MPAFFVWDELNDSRVHAATLEAFDAGSAAAKYAEADCDGQTDGIYNDGHPIMVEDSAGERWRVHVEVEYEPSFGGHRPSPACGRRLRRCR